MDNSLKTSIVKYLFKDYGDLQSQLYNLVGNYDQAAMDINVNLLSMHMKALKKHLSQDGLADSDWL